LEILMNEQINCEIKFMNIDTTTTTNDNDKRQRQTTTN